MSIAWTAQRPLTIALVLTVLSVLACIGLVVVDRRPLVAPASASPRFAVGEPPLPIRRRWIASAAWVAGAAVLVGPGWGLVAAVASAVLVLGLGRPRLAGLVTMGILTVIGAVIVDVVRTERPWPDAGWPVRFEWLHGLGLFAAVSLAVIGFASVRSPSDSSAAPRRTGRTSSPPTPG